ncbi:alanine racemase [Limimaricola soesokkakensis]|uniref:Alanine racemase n=1 Tax=Limimaricola soesokkakensis TaxID=1343159 RepID=A0A1X6YER3_9RHOB|nr:alanine racemase [Limimaricola soesokkakensis]PSK82179.1 alanine racemase [Limimaricola soesokkakensis]SLN19206.1 Alanine racemase, biosynthetic [Limimaricola soesokkakensis]
MSTGALTIDLDALAANWRALDAMTSCETGAVVKADGYGLGAARVARRLAHEGARRFFVAVAEEGAALRRALGPAPEIYVFSGHMEGDTRRLAAAALIPMLNSIDQLARHLEALPGHAFGIQLDTGMNRLGFEWSDWSEAAGIALDHAPVWLTSHLACADEPDHEMNPYQLDIFRQMTDGLGVPRSLSATGGILLGRDYHFDMTRPGIGLYGGLPFDAAQPVVRLDLPVVQCRDLVEGEVVGYGNSWQADRPSRIATISGGYADGLIRAMSGRATFWHGDTPCPLVGRVSMDLITVDVTDLGEDPEYLTLLGPHQGVDSLAEAAGTIGYEILTSLGSRYARIEIPG